MKILLLACVLVLFSCNEHKSIETDLPVADTAAPPDRTVNEKEIDTVKKITVFLNDTLSLEYHADSYSGFERWFKEMPANKIMPPDDAYNEFMSSEKYKALRINFDSEQGQDGFYLLYAYFLQQHNGREKHIRERAQITAAYHGINRLKSYYQYGGTFFGHMRDRIFGYAEYSIYRLDKSLDDKTDIAAEKKTFISMLKKVYTEKLQEDGDTPRDDKPERLKQMMKMIDDVGDIITNAYILKEVKQFYNDHYNYWM